MEARVRVKYAFVRDPRHAARTRLLSVENSKKKGRKREGKKEVEERRKKNRREKERKLTREDRPARDENYRGGRPRLLTDRSTWGERGKGMPRRFEQGKERRRGC